uniref:Uncharacterized protein n=1 Tax=Rhizophora mucronata TaxID=61149 RepID=A0A2P2J088_RHIMU
MNCASNIAGIWGKCIEKSYYLLCKLDIVSSHIISLPSPLCRTSSNLPEKLISFSSKNLLNASIPF